MAEESGEKETAKRPGSNLFAKFNKQQMQEMKEASKKAGKEDQRAQRATSNVFAKFKKDQIQEFKEAFTMIDQDRDGVISVDDLREIYNSLGRVPSDSDLNEMIKEAPGPINFTMFLTLMGEKLHGMDPEDALRNAFAMFDKEGKGFIPEEYLKDLLENMGDNFGKDEIKQTWKEIPLEGGKVDYQRFVSLIKGKLGEEELAA